MIAYRAEIRMMSAIARLLDELNRTRTVFAGTRLRMVYELPEVALTTGQEAHAHYRKSGPSSRCLKFTVDSQPVLNNCCYCESLVQIRVGSSRMCTRPWGDLRLGKSSNHQGRILYSDSRIRP